jgi:hypothetical protein
MKLQHPRILAWAGEIVWCLLLILGLAGSAPAQSEPPDVGLVTQLSGEVVYWSEAGPKEPTPVQAFMKIRQGDHLKLNPGSLIKLVFFASGRQELWNGPATLKIGDTESLNEGTGPEAQAKPEVSTLPTKVTQRFSSNSVPMPRDRIGRSGVLQLRGAPKKVGPVTLTEEQRQEIAKAKELYLNLKKQTGGADSTAELYLLNVLADYRQYKEMELIIQEMVQKQPNNKSIIEMATWVKKQSGQ